MDSAGLLYDSALCDKHPFLLRIWQEVGLGGGVALNSMPG